MPVKRVGVVGAGTMGAGIAQIAALGGYQTAIYELDSKALQRGMEQLRGALRRGAERGRWSEQEAIDALERIETDTIIEVLGSCDLVIEAAPEDLDLKRNLFERLASACGPETVLATNTSSLSVTAIAAGLPEPNRIVGMHFFNPPALMQLVEVVAGDESGEPALELATEAARGMDRTPIRARDSVGFVANRCVRPFFLESLRMLGRGHRPARRDRPDRPPRRRPADGTVRADGPDRDRRQLRGRPLVLGAVVRRAALATDPDPCADGAPPAGSGARPAAASTSTRRTHPTGPGIPTSRPSGRSSTRTISRVWPDRTRRGVLTRLGATIANEACFALGEGVASADDINTAMRLGYNWPIGSLEWGERLGWAGALGVLEELRELQGEAYRPAPELRARARLSRRELAEVEDRSRSPRPPGRRSPASSRRARRRAPARRAVP